MDSVDKLPISAPYTDTTSKTGLEEGAYVSSVNTPLLYPQAVGTPGPANNHVVYPQQRQERSKKRKFCVRLGHFALVVTLLWLFAPAVFHKFSHFVHYYSGHMDVSTPYNGPNDCVDHAHWTTEENDRSGGHRQFHYVSHTSFDLSRFSDLLYVVGRGSLAHGSFILSDDGEPGSDDVGVEIDVWHNREDVLEKIDVCTLQPEEDKIGVGIFTPTLIPFPRHDYKTEFRVKVKLPRSTDGKLLFFNDFQTDLPIFVHSVGDLKESVVFRSISLRTSNTPIRIESLFAENISAHTSNSPVEGQVSANNEIIIHTSNSPIKIDATIDNDDSTGESSTVILNTSNSPIKSSITLTSSSKHSVGGSFDVTTSTSNAPLEVTFPSAPVDSILHLQAHTSNSPLTAHLHKTYEGTFALDSSAWFRPVVLVDGNAGDPKGEGRRREVQVRVERGHAEGKVWWGEPGEWKGNGIVRLSTSNGPVHLDA